MGFSRQEYWSGVLCPLLGIRTDLGTQGACKHEHAWVHKQAGSSKAENTTEASGDGEGQTKQLLGRWPSAADGQDGQAEALSTGPDSGSGGMGPP